MCVVTIAVKRNADAVFYCRPKEATGQGCISGHSSLQIFKKNLIRRRIVGIQDTTVLSIYGIDFDKNSTVSSGITDIQHIFFYRIIRHNRLMRI